MNAVLGMLLALYVMYLGYKSLMGTDLFKIRNLSRGKDYQMQTGLDTRFILLYTFWNTFFVCRIAGDYRAISVIIPSLYFPLVLWKMGYDWLQVRALSLLATLVFMTLIYIT